MSFLDYSHDNLFIIIFNYLFWLYWAFVAVLSLSLFEVMGEEAASLVVRQGFLQLPKSSGILIPRPRIELTFPALEG